MKKHQEQHGAETRRNGHHILLLAAAFFLLAALVAGEALAGEILSRAAVVMDSETGRVLYAKNPDLRLMPASTTKLMTALVVVERANLKDVVTVSKYAASVSATRVGLRAGDRVTVESLLYAALMKSANDAAVALAEAVAGSEEKFVELMNRKAIAIGANDTRYINANGLPGDGQYITAFDLAKVMRQAIRYPILKEVLGTRITEVSTETGKKMFIRNTNRLLWSDEELLGGKTGYTRQARHCFVCAGERDKDTIIVALLGAPSRELLWKESEELLTFGAKVMNKTEEPVVYLAKTDYAQPAVMKASYGKKASGHKVKLKAKARKHKAHYAKKKSASKTKLASRQRKKSRVLAKNRKAIRQDTGQGDDGA